MKKELWDIISNIKKDIEYYAYDVEEDSIWIEMSEIDKILKTHIWKIYIVCEKCLCIKQYCECY